MIARFPYALFYLRLKKQAIAGGRQGDGEVVEEI